MRLSRDPYNILIPNSMKGQEALKGLFYHLCLLLPCGLLAWFHHTFFPLIVTGTKHLWREDEFLPAGFQVLIALGNGVFLLPVIISVSMLLSLKFARLRSAFWLATCGG